METLQGEARQDILKLDDGIQIKVNLLNWILLIPPRHYSYFPTLEDLLVDLLDYKIKLSAINSPKKDFSSLKDSIEKSKIEIRQIMKSLTTVKDGV